MPDLSVSPVSPNDGKQPDKPIWLARWVSGAGKRKPLAPSRSRQVSGGELNHPELGASATPAAAGHYQPPSGWVGGGRKRRGREPPFWELRVQVLFLIAWLTLRAVVSPPLHD